MGRRITRAKAKIKAARIPYRVPEDGEVTGLLALMLLLAAINAVHTSARDGRDTD